MMTDNAMSYRNGHRFQQLIAASGARHIKTPPYTPRSNGKVERFIQTLQREWAYAHTWPSSSSRACGLQSFIRYYNRHRPHGSLDGQPPISRIYTCVGLHLARGAAGSSKRGVDETLVSGVATIQPPRMNAPRTA